jgi:hypothetical protein
MVAISNVNLIMGRGILKTWIESVQQAMVGPWMVLAIDEALKGYLDSHKIPNFLIKQEIAAVQQGTGSNHAVSALKFGILAEFLRLGWHVLLSDVDVVTLSDPFSHLYRDRDIEGSLPNVSLANESAAVHSLEWNSLGSSTCVKEAFDGTSCPVSKQHGILSTKLQAIFSSFDLRRNPEVSAASSR